MTDIGSTDIPNDVYDKLRAYLDRQSGLGPHAPISYAGRLLAQLPPRSQPEPAWRVGTHYGIHVYAGDLPVATFLTAADAKRAVEAVNGRRVHPPQFADHAEQLRHIAQSCIRDGRDAHARALEEIAADLAGDNDDDCEKEERI